MGIAVLWLKPPSLRVAGFNAKKLSQHWSAESAVRVQRRCTALDHSGLLHPKRRVPSRQCASVDSTHVRQSRVQNTLVKDDSRPSRKICRASVWHRQLLQGAVCSFLVAVTTCSRTSLRLEKWRFIVPTQ